MTAQDPKIDEKLAGLRLDRSERQRKGSPRWTKWWILLGVLIFVLLGVWVMGFGESVPVVETMRVTAQTAGEAGDSVALEAAGYVVPHHKIEVASKVVGKVAWIGVEKGDPVKKGQVMVRLEDDEYRRPGAARRKAISSRSRPACGSWKTARGPRRSPWPRPISTKPRPNLDNTKVNLDRSRKLVAEGVSGQAGPR